MNISPEDELKMLKFNCLVDLSYLDNNKEQVLQEPVGLLQHFVYQAAWRDCYKNISVLFLKKIVTPVCLCLTSVKWA